VIRHTQKILLEDEVSIGSRELIQKGTPPPLYTTLSFSLCLEGEISDFEPLSASKPSSFGRGVNRQAIMDIQSQRCRGCLIRKDRLEAPGCRFLNTNMANSPELTAHPEGKETGLFQACRKPIDFAKERNPISALSLTGQCQS
jgi:hypothetical protein